MLCLMGADFYNVIRPAIHKLILEGVLDPYSVTEIDNKRASGCEVELSAFMLVVLMSWLGINKAVSSSKSQNVIDWIAQRDKPLLLKMGAMSLDPEVRRCLHANVAVDMLVIGTYLNDNRTLRKVLYEQLLTKDTELTDYGKNIKELAGGILKFTGMSTVKIAYNFAKACETMAHTNREVVNQSIKLEKYWESKCNEKHWHYYYLLNGADPELSSTNYPHLIYCAIEHEKINKGGTWEKYELKTGGINTLELSTKLKSKLLSQIVDGGEDSDDVNNYLKSKGKRVGTDEEKTHDIAALINCFTKYH